MTQQIVCETNVSKYYGGNLELLEKYKKIAEGGKCPFCTDNILKEHKLVEDTKWWNIIWNPFPYPNSLIHLLVVPKRHITTLLGLTSEEWADIKHVIEVLTVGGGFRIKDGFLALGGRDDMPGGGYGLAVRVGELGGVTLWHLHFHLIVPKLGPDDQIPVNFGIG